MILDVTNCQAKSFRFPVSRSAMNVHPFQNYLCVPSHGNPNVAKSKLLHDCRRRVCPAVNRLRSQQSLDPGGTCSTKFLEGRPREVAASQGRKSVPQDVQTNTEYLQNIHKDHAANYWQRRQTHAVFEYYYFAYFLATTAN
jgi:hypothetical protein